MAKIKKITWNNEAWNDFSKMIETHDKARFSKINKLINDIIKNGFDKGLGKPEQLKHELTGMWSREINKKDRLVYFVEEDTLFIVQCETHYDQV